MNRPQLAGWLFTFNPHTQCYDAAKREHMFELFNGDLGNVLSSKVMSTLEALIIKTDGDQVKIKALLDSAGE